MMNIRDLFLGSLPVAMNIHELRHSPKIEFQIFRIFFRLKPAPDHELQCYTKFIPTALILWTPIRLGRTDGRTDGQTDGRRASFLERYGFDNHPFGVDNF